MRFNSYLSSVNQQVNQWQDGYPNALSAKADIRAGTSYVRIDENIVVATASIAFGTEPSYEQIVHGSWQKNPAIYGFIHRVAVSPNYAGKGLAGMLFQHTQSLAKALQVNVLGCDTHEKNVAMHKTLQKQEYHLCGTIYLSDGSRRQAYEKLLP